MARGRRRRNPSKPVLAIGGLAVAGVVGVLFWQRSKLFPTLFPAGKYMPVADATGKVISYQWVPAGSN